MLLLQHIRAVFGPTSSYNTVINVQNLIVNFQDSTKTRDINTMMLSGRYFPFVTLQEVSNATLYKSGCVTLGRLSAAFPNWWVSTQTWVAELL